MSIRLLEFKQEEGKDMYLVEYPGKGQRWVYSFMIGGQYKDEKAALKYRFEERNGVGVPSNTIGQNSIEIEPSSDIPAVADNGLIPAKTHVEKREALKCICQQHHAIAGEEIITCSLCSKRSHLRCVRAEGLSPSELKEWQCIFKIKKILASKE